MPDGPLESIRVDIGEGRHLRLKTGGFGPACVLFDAGWAQWSVVWANIQPEIARAARTCAFDRLGLGESDPPQDARSAFQVVDELQAALVAAEIPGPYIVVGHSMGAVHARVLAHREPAVRGLVLVDPVVLALGVSRPFQEVRLEVGQMLERVERYAELGVLRPVASLLRVPPASRKLPRTAARELRRGYTSETLNVMRAELAALETSMDELRRLGAPAVPYHILSASEDWLPGEAADGPETRVQSMHRKLAEHSPHGVYEVVPDTSHDVHLDAPEAVIAAVLRLVETLDAPVARTSSSP